MIRGADVIPLFLLDIEAAEPVNDDRTLDREAERVLRRERKCLVGSSKDRLRSSVASIAGRATPDDIFILTYSGHAYSDPDGMCALWRNRFGGDRQSVRPRCQPLRTCRNCGTPGPGVLSPNLHSCLAVRLR